MKGSPFKLAVIITLIIAALITVLVIINNRSTDSDVVNEDADGPSPAGQPTIGKEDASVTIIEFGDFKCPACKIWGEIFYPELEKDYIDTGKASFSFVNVLFHGEESKLASLAAESVFKQNPDVYWDFHNKLFEAQPQEEHDTEWVTEEKIMEIANSISGIDTEQLKADLKDETEVDALKTDTELVDQFNVEMTPTIMINGTMIEDPFDYEEITKTIEHELERQQGNE